MTTLLFIVCLTSYFLGIITGAILERWNQHREREETPSTIPQEPYILYLSDLQDGRVEMDGERL